MPSSRARGDRGERVLDVEAALELQVDAVERVRAELAASVGEAVRERVGPVLGSSRRPHSSPTLIAAGGAALEEQPPLGLEVGAPSSRAGRGGPGVRFVKTSAGEADAVEPAELGAVRGRLDRAAPVARVEHLAERALEVDRLGRRAHGRAPLAADRAISIVPIRPGLAAGGLEDRVEEERGRRLAVRAGDAGDLRASRSGGRRTRRRRRPSPRARRRRRAAARARSTAARRRARRRRPRPPAAAKSCPSARGPGHAEEERCPGATARVS